LLIGSVTGNALEKQDGSPSKEKRPGLLRPFSLLSDDR
jgi:hypothetical protein